MGSEGHPSELHWTPGCRAVSLQVTPLLSLSSVISMRCMVQFVGREAKYR